MTLGLLLSCSKSVNLSRNTGMFLSVFRNFGTKSLAYSFYRERFKLELELANVNASTDALYVYEKMTRMRPLLSVVYFNRLLSRLVKLEEYHMAISLFKDICRLKIPVDVRTLNTAINCYCRTNRVDLGFSILSIFFRKKHCVPNQFTVNTLLKGLFEENRISEAQQFFKTIVRRRLCELDMVTYRILIDELCKTDDDEMFVDLLKFSNPNLIICNNLLQELFSRRRSLLALKIFLEMNLGGKENFITYCYLLHGLCRDGHVEQAWCYLQDLRHQKVSLHIEYYNIIMGGFCEAKRPSEALDIFNRQRTLSPRVDALSYGTIIKGFVDNGLLEEAKNIFQEMKDRSVLPKSATYDIIIQESLTRGEYDDAANFLEEMMGERRFFPDSSTQCLLLHSMGEKENNTHLVKVIEKFLAPTALARRKTALACQSDSEVGSNLENNTCLSK